jgi:hypothetical protein
MLPELHTLFARLYPGNAISAVPQTPDAIHLRRFAWVSCAARGAVHNWFRMRGVISGEAISIPLDCMRSSSVRHRSDSELRPGVNCRIKQPLSAISTAIVGPVAERRYSRKDVSRNNMHHRFSASAHASGSLAEPKQRVSAVLHGSHRYWSHSCPFSRHNFGLRCIAATTNIRRTVRRLSMKGSSNGQPRRGAASRHREQSSFPRKRESTSSNKLRVADKAVF